MHAQSAKSTHPKNLSADILDRIHHWTNGHPYLTQRLCRTVAELPDSVGRQPSVVDKVCSDLFLTHSGRESDDNLTFVRNRMLKSDVDVSALLDAYTKIRGGKDFPDDETSSISAVLKLSGVAKVENGLLRIRNRIYRHVFDRAWVEQHMPDAELRRQKAAYRRGMLRSAAVFSAVSVVMGALAVTAFLSFRNAVRQRDLASAATSREAEQRKIASDRLYVAELGVAEQALEAGNAARAREILTAHAANPEVRVLREFAWRYLWGRTEGRDLFVYRGLPDGINSAVFSPDGRTLAIGGDRGEIQLLGPLGPLGPDESTRMTLLPGQPTPIRDLAFSRDGRLLYSGGGDGVVVRDVASRKVTGAIAFPLRRMALSPDGRTLGIGSIDGAVSVWDSATLHKKSTLIGSNLRVSALCFSPDSALLAVAHDGQPVCVWRLSTGEAIRKLSGHRGFILDLRFSQDGKNLCAAGDDASVRLWDVSTGRTVAQLRGHRGRVRSVAFTGDNQSILSAGEDGALRIWNADEKTQRSILMGGGSEALSVAVQPKGSLAVTTGPEGTVRFWDLNAARNHPLAESHGAKLSAVQISPDGKYLATSTTPGDGSGQVVLFQRDGMREITRYQGAADGLRNFAFMPDNRIAVAPGMGGQSRGIRVWDWKTNRVAVWAGSHTSWHIAASQNGKWVANGSGATHSVVLWDASTGKSEDLGHHENDVTDMVFSPDSRLLASCGAEGSIKIWDLDSRKLAATLTGHKGAVLAVAFSQDGKLLASAGDDRKIICWDTGSWKPAFPLTGHATAILSVAFSPDGETLASAGKDGALVLWSRRLRQPLLTLPDRHEQVSSVAFSPDGATLLVAAADSAWTFSAPSRDEAEKPPPAEREVRIAAASPLSEEAVSKERRASINAQGWITDWLVLGPVGGSEEKLGDVLWSGKRLLPADAALMPADGQTASTASGALKWRRFQSQSAMLQMDEAMGSGESSGAGYAAAYVVAPRDIADARVHLANGSETALFLDSDLLLEEAEYHHPKDNRPAEARMRLVAGIHRILLRFSGAFAAVRITDGAGLPIPELRMTTSPGSLVAAPALVAKLEALPVLLVNAGGGAAKIRRDGDAQRIEIPRKSDRPVEIFRPDDGLVEGKTYRVTFRARADRPRSIHVRGVNADGEWRDASESASFSLSTRESNYTCRLRVTHIGGRNLLPVFSLGNDHGKVWIRQLRVTTDQ